MPPVVSLPTIQHWDCSGCGECCRSYAVRVTEVEKARLESHGWEGGSGVIADGAGGYRLAHRPDGVCVFLGDDNRCRVQAKVGAAAKPLTCRLYPFVLVPAGKEWRVGMRLACPAAVANEGRPLTAHAAEVRGYAAQLAADAGITGELPPPPLQGKEVVPWVDRSRFAATFSGIVAGDGPLDYRLRQVIAVAAACRKSRFDAISGARLGEFLTVMTAAVTEDVPRDATAVPPPGWLGRTVFRQVAAIATRKDNGTDAGIASRSRWVRLRSAWRFAAGRGPVPRLHGRIPDTATFEVAERPQPLPPEADALLTRYYRLKLDSLQFCGRTNFGRPFWPGLDSLLLTYPVIRWLGRVFAADGLPVTDAVKLAVQAVDDGFGYHPHLGTRRIAWGIDTLTDRGELAKLVAWYGR